MASAARARRKLAAVKAKARVAGRRATRRKARPDPIPPQETVERAPDRPRLDPTRGFVSLAGEQRLQQLRAAATELLAASAPTPRPAQEAAAVPPRPTALPKIPLPVVTPLAERRFAPADHGPVRLGKAHWTWTIVAYVACLALATQAALALPENPSNADSWRSFAIWSFFVLAAACVLLLSWRNFALPALVAMLGIFLVAWRGPFLAMGVFSDAGDWTNNAVPWWSLLTITFITKALETRGRRRRYQLRSLMVLQGMQIATYAGLVLLSIFFLGRTGSIRADWTITIVSLLAAWFIQGRSLLVMWNRTVGAPKTAEVVAPTTVWNPSYEHTGK